MCGSRQLQQIFIILEKVLEEESLFLRFLQEFDIFVRKYKISKERLNDYEEKILNLKPYMTDALKKDLMMEACIFPTILMKCTFR